MTDFKRYSCRVICLLVGNAILFSFVALVRMEMQAARTQVTVFSSEDGTKKSSTVALPEVFLAPIRPDIVNFVHTNMRKNARQPYAVSEAAGHQTSAISWGTGRAVSRIPRISGGGTGRSGQGAYGKWIRIKRLAFCN